MPHIPGHRNVSKSIGKLLKVGRGRMGGAPTQPGQRFFGDVDAGISKRDLGAQVTNAEKRRMLEQMRDTSGAQVTSAVLKRYLRGQK